jgi:hypothetical protein
MASVNYEKEAEELRRKQLEANRAWQFLEEKGVPNLDIERTGQDKVTLTELLVEFRRREGGADGG